MNLTSMNLTSMSIGELKLVAETATNLAKELEGHCPSIQQAILNGVRDTSYTTVRYGYVSSFAKKAFVRQANGVVWLCTGHGTSGNAEYISREGYIDFQKLGLLNELDEQTVAEIASASYTNDEMLIADALEFIYRTQ